MAAVFAAPAFGFAGLPQSALFAGLSGLSAVAITVGALHGPRSTSRGGWLLLAAGQFAYTIGDTLYFVQNNVLGDDTYPSVADAFYLLQYPLIVAALLRFVRRRTPDWHSPALLDSAIVATGVALVFWVYVIRPLAGASELSALALGVTVAYPIGDLLVIVVGLGLLLGEGTRTPSYWLLLASLLSMLAGDIGYALQTVEGAFVEFGWVDVAFLGSYVLAGAAALHPSKRRIDRSAGVATPDASRGRVLVLASASLLAPVVLFIQYQRGMTQDVPIIAVACTVLFLLVLARMSGLVAAQRRVAVTDGLTGLATRRAFEQRLREEAAAGRIGLLLVDVDHFKSINDTYGHPAGDRVLVELGRRLRAVCRPGDVVARYGGEEFALLASGADAEELRRLAERVRYAVAVGPFELGEGIIRPVTVSVGLAHGPVPDEVVKLADRALYAAKRNGRNQVATVDAADTRVPSQPRPLVLAANGPAARRSGRPAPAVNSGIPERTGS
jgi:diguanylate cyclase (GGDEF)-like protein